MNRLSRFWVRLLAAVLIAGSGVVLLGAAPASKVKILSRTRLGGSAQDLAYVTTGPLAKNLVMIEGYEIWGIPNQAAGKAKLRKLFDLYKLDPVPWPVGIAWVESRRLFVVNDGNEGSDVLHLYFVDHQGRLKGTASMIFPLPDGYAPAGTDGLSYIPARAGQYPDHLVIIAQNDDLTADLLITDLAGQVVKHFRPQCYDAAGNLLEFLGSVEYLSGDRLAITDWNYQGLCVVDFDGVQLAPAISFDPASGIGDIAQLASGRIAMHQWPQNLLFFDAELNRLPELDRHDVVGLGLNNALGLAWDGLESQHLLSYDSRAASWTANFWSGWNTIAAVSPKLKASTAIVDLTDYPEAPPGQAAAIQVRRMSFLQDESRIVLASRGQGALTPPVGWSWSPLRWLRGLLLYERGVPGPVEQIDLSAYGRPIAVAHIPRATPADGRFAVGFLAGDPANLYTAYLFSRAGAFLGTIDFNATAGLTNVQAMEYFDAPDGSGGRFAILGRDAASSHWNFVVTDLDGSKLDSFDVMEKLRLPSPNDVSVITTGCPAGAFAVLDNSAQTLVVFRMK